MLPGLDLYYADRAQPLITACDKVLVLVDKTTVDQHLSAA